MPFYFTRVLWISSVRASSFRWVSPYWTAKQFTAVTFWKLPSCFLWRPARYGDVKIFGSSIFCLKSPSNHFKMVFYCKILCDIKIAWSHRGDYGFRYKKQMMKSFRLLFLNQEIELSCWSSLALITEIQKIMKNKTSHALSFKFLSFPKMPLLSIQGGLLQD